MQRHLIARAARAVVSVKDQVVATATPVWRRIEASAPFQRAKRSSLWTKPWIGWVFVYSFSLFAFFMYRWSGLRGLLEMYGTPKDDTLEVKLRVLGLGFLEDLVCVTYLTLALWLFDSLKHASSKSNTLRHMWKNSMLVRRYRLTTRKAGDITTFAGSWILFVVVMAPVVADLLIVQIRGMRFSFELIAMAIAERKYLTAAPISVEEVNKGYVSAFNLVIVASVFSCVRMKASWTDLTRWSPTLAVEIFVLPRESRLRRQPDNVHVDKDSPKVIQRNLAKDLTYVDIEISSDSEVRASEYSHENQDTESLLPSSRADPTVSGLVYKRIGIQITILSFALVFAPAIIVALSCASSPLVAYSALNASLNELFSHALEPALDNGLSTVGEAWVETYIHNATEVHDLFGDDILYRRTTNFKGDLEFDVKVSADNPPNVLIIAVESFQFHDSRYLVGDEDPSNLFKGTNLTITPNFDRWAKRGVALRNFWSSVRTSRSVESMLYAQIPYDSPVNTGTTGGKTDTRLAGLPQLFSAKGYETFFTTGCTTHYDEWDTFLPTHGFDTVWSETELKVLAEKTLGIKHADWKPPEARKLVWGVHDDLSFQLLGDLLIKKKSEQDQRMAKGIAKKPLFLTHYTISSHGPYQERPRWYAEAEKPDFSELCKVSGDQRLCQDYLEMRYFSDMELGRFLDRMEAEGILNDTIVVITGDHGTGDDVSAMRVAGAIIAEGRLGDAAGLVLDDAAEHYDLLNTLADITGVPEGGFLQDGVGRSLKRKVPFGERVVFSNDPNHNMAIVRGHQRFRYHRISDAVLLHDIDTDHHMNKDLFPGLSAAEQEEWLAWRDHGRRINLYYTHRWDNKCLLTVKC